MATERTVHDYGTHAAPRGWVRRVSVDLVGRTHFVRVRAHGPNGEAARPLSLGPEVCASILRAAELCDVGLGDRTLAVEEHEGPRCGYLRVSAAWRGGGPAIAMQWLDAWRSPVGRVTFVDGTAFGALLEAARWMTGEVAA